MLLLVHLCMLHHKVWPTFSSLCSSPCEGRQAPDMLHTWRDLGYHAQCRQNSNIKGTLLQLQRQKLGDVTVNTSERPASGYLLSPCTHITIPSLNTITTIFSLHLAPNIIAAHLE